MHTELAKAYAENLSFVLERLDRTRFTYAEIGESSGVPARTVQKLKLREIAEPSVRSLDALVAFFKAHPESYPAR